MVVLSKVEASLSAHVLAKTTQRQQNINVSFIQGFYLLTGQILLKFSFVKDYKVKTKDFKTFHLFFKAK